VRTIKHLCGIEPSFVCSRPMATSHENSSIPPLSSQPNSPPPPTVETKSRFRIERISAPQATQCTSAGAVRSDPTRASRFTVIRVPRSRVMSDARHMAIDDELSGYLGNLRRPMGQQRGSAMAQEDPLIDPFLS
jgi:hypothetical protein